MKAPRLAMCSAIAFSLLLLECAPVAGQAAERKYTVVDIASLILSGFPYDEGHLPNEWCYSVDTENHFNWWYMKHPDAGFKAYRVRNAARIPAIYAGDADVPKKYASIFLGLEFEGDKDVRSFNKLLFQRAQGDTVRYEGKGIQPNPCKMSDFLLAYGIPYLMEVPEDPAEAKFDEADHKKDDYRYWSFLGRIHKITNIRRYKIDLRYDKGKDDYFKAWLIVGYGGGAGP